MTTFVALPLTIPTSSALSVGGLLTGLFLYLREPSSGQVLFLAVLPFSILVGESFAPTMNSRVEIRDSVVINASPETIWAQILAAEDIEADELPSSITHTIGAPRPIEGINRMTPAGEIRFSRWERGVRFEGGVSERCEHVEIGGRYAGHANPWARFRQYDPGPVQGQERKCGQLVCQWFKRGAQRRQAHAVPAGEASAPFTRTA